MKQNSIDIDETDSILKQIEIRDPVEEDIQYYSTEQLPRWKDRIVVLDREIEEINQKLLNFEGDFF